MKFLSTEKVLARTKGAAGLRSALYQAKQPVPSFVNISQWKTKRYISGVYTAPILYVLCLLKVDIAEVLDDTANYDTGSS